MVPRMCLRQTARAAATDGELADNTAFSARIKNAKCVASGSSSERNGTHMYFALSLSVVSTSARTRVGAGTIARAIASCSDSATHASAASKRRTAIANHSEAPEATFSYADSSSQEKNFDRATFAPSVFATALTSAALRAHTEIGSHIKTMNATKLRICIDSNVKAQRPAACGRSDSGATG